MCTLSANYKETCEKLTENTAFTQLKHNIKPVGLYRNTSQLRFRQDLMVYFFVYGALLKPVASSLFFLYTKILCVHRAVSNSRFNVQKISTLNCWKIRINQEILEEIYASNSVIEFCFRI